MKARFYSIDSEHRSGTQSQLYCRIHEKSSLGIHDQQTYWGYEDIGIFFSCTLFIGLLLHSAVHLRVLTQATLNRPPLMLQAAILLSLMGCLYMILKIRYRRHVWLALGWTTLHRRPAVNAALGGIVLAIPVVLFIHWSQRPLPVIPVWDFVLLGAVLGPALEESFFRGCLLPVFARTLGAPVATFISALLFTALHKPPTSAQSISFTITGIAYGWLRVRSGSTTASIVMHSAYNITLFLFQISGLCR